MNKDLEKLLFTERECEVNTGIQFIEIERIAKLKYPEYNEYPFSSPEHTFTQSVLFTILTYFLISSFYISPTILVSIFLFWTFRRLLGLTEVDWNLGSSVITSILISSLIAILISLIGYISIMIKRHRDLKSLEPWQDMISLFTTVKQYNQLIKAIDVKDQLDQLQNENSNPQDRKILITTLQDRKNELNSALKIEKILRENQSIIKTNPTLFESALTSINVNQVNTQSSRYKQQIEEALSIGVSIRNEIKNMQTKKQ